TLTVSGQDPASSVADSDIQRFIQQQISSGAVPTPDSNTLYFIFLPSGVTVALGGSSSCQDFCGYHDAIGGQTYYAVMPYPSCNGCLGGLSTFNALTATSSHEFSEAITDPVPGQGWYDDANGEIGDICEGSNKTISNGAAAKAGTTSFTVSVNPQTVVVDGSAPINLTLTLTPAGAATPPPPATLSYVVQKEWSNAQNA